jgi:hypothetical protein
VFLHQCFVKTWVSLRGKDELSDLHPDGISLVSENGPLLIASDRLAVCTQESANDLCVAVANIVHSWHVVGSAHLNWHADLPISYCKCTFVISLLVLLLCHLRSPIFIFI